MVDPDEDPCRTALRELREETGYRGGRVTALGSIHPNPAIQNNRAHMFLVEDCEREGELVLDAGEDIEVVVMPLPEVLSLLESGGISHALVAVALQRFLMLREGRLSLR
jgi:8-oxo-dGTP pyrophosphatase MutT (NUDIX family)